MSSRATVLVVENDGTMQGLIEQNLRPRYIVLMSADVTQALLTLSHTEVDVVVLDLRVVSGDDAKLFDEFCIRTSGTPMVLVTGCGSGAEAVRAVKAPLRVHELPHLLDDAVTELGLVREMLRTAALGEEANGLVAESPAMQTVMSLIDRAALSDTPVLIIGESGTGKELLARALHARGPRVHGPFIAVNCSAIPETLLESELFGHRRGAFTDARDDRPGLFQAAHRGTIFLDEIGDMAPALQGKLLRVLQEREVHPLGAPAPVPVDVRTVTATHRDLYAWVAEGRFRDDLLYRINVIEVRVPPLRDRPEDLFPLVAHFLQKHGMRLGKPGRTMSAEVMSALRRHTWPGNVRELENLIERALVLGSRNTICVEDLPDTFRRESQRQLNPGIGRRLADVERDHILGMLRALGGNKAAAARALGLNRKTLYRKLAQHRILGVN